MPPGTCAKLVAGAAIRGGSAGECEAAQDKRRTAPATAGQRCAIESKASSKAAAALDVKAARANSYVKV